MPGCSLRSSARTASVESTVRWSSMSRVTVVPIAVAASTTGRTSSSARSCPSRQRLAEGRQLHRHLGGRGPGRSGGQPVEQRAGRRPGCASASARSVMSSPRWSRVTCDAVGGQRADGGERVVQGLAGDEPVDDPAGGRVAGDGTAQPGTAGRGEQGLLQSTGPPGRGRDADTPDARHRHPFGPGTDVQNIVPVLSYRCTGRGRADARRPAGARGRGVPAARRPGDAGGRRLHPARLLRPRRQRRRARWTPSAPGRS